MGQLVEGKWTDDERRVQTGDGSFQRPRAAFRERITADGSSGFPAERGRYHLFVNRGCPWAYRTVLYRRLEGLEEAISLSATEPAMGPEGWTFGDAGDALLGVRHLHQVYTHADPTYTGRVTVPVLFDKKTGKIVNNESAEIIRMLDHAFDALGASGVDYYPPEHRAEIDELNGWIYTDVNNGVYRCGFAASQAAYDEAFARLFAALDRLETRLATRRYLCGARPTEADWRLFSTLVRFDTAYYPLFRCNLRRLVDYPNLWAYTRDLWQLPRVGETVDLDAIKGIYWGSRPPHILPRGPEIDFSAPHGRDHLG
jgi:putative glutathione S-transferase